MTDNRIWIGNYELKHKPNVINMTEVKIQQKVIIWHEGTNVCVSCISDFYMYVTIKINAVFSVEYPSKS